MLGLVLGLNLRDKMTTSAWWWWALIVVSCASGLSSTTRPFVSQTIAARARLLDALENDGDVLGAIQNIGSERFEAQSFIDLAMAGDWTLRYPKPIEPVFAVTKSVRLHDGQGDVVHRFEWRVNEFDGVFESCAAMAATAEKQSFAFQGTTHFLKPRTKISGKIMPQALIADIARAVPSSLFDPSSCRLIYADPTLKILQLQTSFHVWSR